MRVNISMQDVEILFLLIWKCLIFTIVLNINDCDTIMIEGNCMGDICSSCCISYSIYTVTILENKSVRLATSKGLGTKYGCRGRFILNSLYHQGLRSLLGLIGSTRRELQYSLEILTVCKPFGNSGSLQTLWKFWQSANPLEILTVCKPFENSDSL